MARARIITARSAPISPQEQPPPARAPREVERPGRVRGARQRRNRFLIVARLHRPRDEEDSQQSSKLESATRNDGEFKSNINL